MIYLLNFLAFLPFLLIYGAIIFGLVVALRKAGVPKRSAVFAAFTLFGILSGLVVALYGHHEGQYIFNILGVLLGEEVYTYSIHHFGDIHSAFAHYTIPWVLRIPQVCLFTSAIVWGVLGLVAQLTYNAVKKPVATKGVTTLIIVVSLIALLGASVGAVYVTQGEHKRQGPIQPSAYPIMEAGTPPTPEWETITTWEVESLSLTPWGPEGSSLSDVVIEVGQDLIATGVVKNTGSKKGIAEVEIEVDGRVLNSQKVALLPGESRPVKFVILVLRQGSYTVRMGDLTESFEAIETD